MTSFSDIERAYESKYGHDLEQDFKAVMRRNKLLGLWAAEKMGITGADADAYAREVIEADFEHAGHEDVLKKVFSDLEKQAVEVSEHIVERKMHDFLVEAKADIEKELSR